MKRVLAALLPGERRVWIGALIVVLPILVLLGHALSAPRDYMLGTNSVGTISLVVDLSDGHKLCVPRVELPRGTGQIRVSQFTFLDRPSIRAEVITNGRTVATGQSPPARPGPLAAVAIPISPALRVAATGTVCISTHGSAVGRVTQLGGMRGLESDGISPTLDGNPIGSRIALWFLPPPGAQRSLAANWPAMMNRLALFRPGFAGAWLYYVLFFAVIPLLGYAALRTLAVAERGSRRSVIWSLAAIAFVASLAWAITTAPFDSPDESEHFSYTQSIAEQGRAPDPQPTGRSAYSGDEIAALEAVHHFSTIETADARPPWLAQDVAHWRTRVSTTRPSPADGGGYSIAVSLHSPLYYSLLVGGYELGRGGGAFAELFWMRAVSALLGVIVVLCAYGIVRELAPRRPREAVAAALLVAFEPMFGFISGAVNNDAGVNAAAAALIYLLVRALARQRVGVRLGIAIGVVAAILPLAKGTGYELLPALLAAIALVASRGLGARAARAVRAPSAGAGPTTAGQTSQTLPRRFFGLAATVLGLAAVTLAWSHLAGGFHRATITTPGGAAPTAIVAGGGAIGGHLVYFWETFLPRLPFMSRHWTQRWPAYDIYVRRGFAGFGWYILFFPAWVYHVIVVVGALVAAGILAAVARCRRAVIRRWRELLVLTFAVLGVFGGVEYVYYARLPRPPADLPEQGRYAFPAIAGLAALAIFGTRGAGRRLAPYLVSGLVAAMVGLSMASHLLYLALRYT